MFTKMIPVKPQLTLKKKQIAEQTHTVGFAICSPGLSSKKSDQFQVQGLCIRIYQHFKLYFIS